MFGIVLIIGPLIAGLASFFIRNDRYRRVLALFCSGAHLFFTGLTFFRAQSVLLSGWFALDAPGFIFLAITSLLFFGAALYAVKYLDDEKRHSRDDGIEDKANVNEAVFTGCFLFLLSTMTIVIFSQHIAVLWVAIEATTLASAPLIYFHRTKRSLEATWKYLLICSVGIALALFGIFFLGVANKGATGMLLKKMIQNASLMDASWLKASFLLLFVGYGTKMGLAPFHTWLPDAHSEAPSVISALLSGALLNCAFLGILRGYQICAAAGLSVYCREIFVLFGLISLLFAAVFILGQKDYKRMLAYSSVEHMGIITLGIGLGGGAVFGALVNMLGHSLTKVGLFFIAGNILSYYGTKNIAAIKGLAFGKTRSLGILWLAGFLLITGTPPSAIFFGKFMILKEALLQRHYWVTFIFLFALGVVFIGMAQIFVSMTQGAQCGNKNDNPVDPGGFLKTAPSVLFFILAVFIGLYVPAWLTQALAGAAGELGGY